MEVIRVFKYQEETYTMHFAWCHLRDEKKQIIQVRAWMITLNFDVEGTTFLSGTHVIYFGNGSRLIIADKYYFSFSESKVFELENIDPFKYNEIFNETGFSVCTVVLFMFLVVCVFLVLLRFLLS